MSNALAPSVLKIYPFGYGDPMEKPPSAPRAPYYDLASRQVLRDATGAYAMQMHPIDQAMAVIAGLQKGSVRCLPDLGIDYSVLEGLPSNRWQNRLNAEVRRAFDLYITRKDITLDPVQITPSIFGTRWSIEWTADYVNNRLPATQRGTKASVGGRY